MTRRDTTPKGRPSPPRVQALPSWLHHGEIAQLVEHTTENRGVPGSSPGLAIRETSCKVEVSARGLAGRRIGPDAPVGLFRPFQRALRLKCGPPTAEIARH